MEYWYALFVKTGFEQKLDEYIRASVIGEGLSPFVPKVERIIKLSGLIKTERKTMFPGYLFVETDLNNLEFNRRMYNTRSFLQEIFRVVRYGESFISSIHEEEKEFLIDLLNVEHCLEASRGIMDGDRVYITEGPLIGRESIIKKIDRHKRKAVIEMDLLGDIRCISVALEIIKKIPFSDCE